MIWLWEKAPRKTTFFRNALVLWKLADSVAYFFRAVNALIFSFFASNPFSVLLTETKTLAASFSVHSLRACLESLHARLACIFSAIFGQNPRETNVSRVNYTKYCLRFWHHPAKESAAALAAGAIRTRGDFKQALSSEHSLLTTHWRHTSTTMQSRGTSPW